MPSPPLRLEGTPVSRSSASRPPRRARPVSQRAVARAGCLLAFALLPAAGAAQAPVRPATEIPGLPPPLPISPGGAFWRAMVLPGWGHAAIGAHGRGAFYAGAQAATVYTLLRTRVRLVEARKGLVFREEALRAAAIAGGESDPDAIEAILDQDDARTELQALVESRESQQEDLLAFSIFLVLLSSADAYVSAHLARFPDPLELETRVSPAGGVDVGLRITLGN